jgi:multidrug efflux system outer membrane protein
VAARRAFATALALALGGCSLAPAYTPPAVAVPAAYKEAGPWTEATPLDTAPRGAWWQGFGDPVLDDLESRIERANPTLAAALARYDRARAAASQARAGLFPEIDAGADLVRERVSAGRPLSTTGRAARYTDRDVGASLSYELDLWGRVRNAVRAGTAEAKASEADVAAARLSLQAQLADTYFALRGADAEMRLLADTVAAYERAADLTRTRHDGGVASGLDVSRAQTVLSTARASLSEVAADRAIAEHRIAALIGEPPASLAIAPEPSVLVPLVFPAGTPSTLLQRRPDIAAAERRVAAANARIGVARAALFPSITLGGSGGFQTTSGALLSAPFGFWALGPASAVLALFDGGKRRAGVRISRAEYAEAAATYRETVLGAFREVEDTLALARHLAAEAKDQRAAAVAAGHTRDLALVRYRDGASDYLDVVTAQTAALESERAVLDLETRRLTVSVDGIRALGGGVSP